MRRRTFALWLLLLVQAVPLCVLIAHGYGLFDPLGAFLEQTLSSPAPPTGANRFIIGALRLVNSWWYFVSLELLGFGALAAILYVAFDRTLMKLERATWAIAFLFGHSVTVILFCVLKLLGTRQQRAVA